MYKGRRDDHFTLRVPQAHCFKYNAQTGKFIEVRLPGFTDNEFDSFMVDPRQVYYDHVMPDVFNVIEELNRGTQIQVSHKIIDDKGNRVIVPGTDRYYDPVELAVIFRACN